MTAPAAAALTAGHRLHPSFSPRPSTASLPPSAAAASATAPTPGDFLAAPRCGAHTRRRRLLPAAGHAQRPLPPAWRPEHGPAHCRGSRPLRSRPPHPWLLFSRDDRAPPRRRCSLPPHGCVLRRGQGAPHRWAWAPSAESLEPGRRRGPDIAGTRTGRRGPHVLCVSASPRWISCRQSHRHRWAWGPPRSFDLPSEPPHRPPARRHVPAHLAPRWAWGPSVVFAPRASSSGNDGPARPPVCRRRRSLVISRHPSHGTGPPS